MARIQLIEIIDQSWCPKVVRDGITDFLQFLLGWRNFYSPAAHLLGNALDQAGAERVVDLCSGAGGPWLHLVHALKENRQRVVQVRLTDRYPNIDAFKRIEKASAGAIRFESQSIDPTAVPSGIGDFRTIFSSFHHFPPSQAKTVIHDAVRNRQGIAIFEFTHRSFLAIMLYCFIPFIVMAFAPFIRPFRWSRLFLTYLIPVLPWLTWFDGTVSCFRTYSPSELRGMVREHEHEGYVWQIGEVSNGPSPFPVTYLIGYPERAQAG